MFRGDSLSGEEVFSRYHQQTLLLKALIQLTTTHGKSFEPQPQKYGPLGFVNMVRQLTQLGLLASDGIEPDELAAQIREQLGAGTNGLEVLAWTQAVPQMVGFVELDDRLGYVYLAVIFGVVLLSVTNTFLMV